MICQGGLLYAQGHIVLVPALKLQTVGYLFSLLLPLLCGPIYLSGNLLCLENPMDGRAWQDAVHGVAKSQTQLSDFTFAFTFMHWRRKWQPTPVLLPGESQGWGSLVGCGLWGRTELDKTEAT